MTPYTTGHVVLEIDDSVSQDNLEKIKIRVLKLLRVMGATETQLLDVFKDEILGYTTASAMRLIEKKEVDIWVDNILFLINNIDNYKWLNHKEVVEKLFNSPVNVMYHLSKFKKLNRNDRMEIVDKWLDDGREWFSVLDSIGQFEEWEQEDILVKLIKREHFYGIKSRDLNELVYWCKFNRKELARKLKENWCWHYVDEYPEFFWLKIEK